MIFCKIEKLDTRNIIGYFVAGGARTLLIFLAFCHFSACKPHSSMSAQHLWAWGASEAPVPTCCEGKKGWRMKAPRKGSLPVTDSSWWRNNSNLWHIGWDDIVRLITQSTWAGLNSSCPQWPRLLPFPSHLPTPLPLFPGTVSHMNDFTPITIRHSVLTQTKKSVPKASVNEGKTYSGVPQGPKLSEKQIFVIHQVHAKI